MNLELAIVLAILSASYLMIGFLCSICKEKNCGLIKCILAIVFWPFVLLPKILPLIPRAAIFVKMLAHLAFLITVAYGKKISSSFFVGEKRFVA